MKVLLLKDVFKLGRAGDVKRVADGYGRNYLIPQKLAVLATPGALKQAETIRKAAEKRRAQETEDAQAIANQIGDLELLFERRAGETGKLYGSVTSNDIAEAILEKTQIDIDWQVQDPSQLRYAATEIIATVLAHAILEHFGTAVITEIEVNIGHRDTSRIQEALEQQLMMQRIHHRDLQYIRDDRTGSRTARIIPNAILFGMST